MYMHCLLLFALGRLAVIRSARNCQSFRTITRDTPGPVVCNCWNPGHGMGPFASRRATTSHIVQGGRFYVRMRCGCAMERMPIASTLIWAICPLLAYLFGVGFVVPLLPDGFALSLDCDAKILLSFSLQRCTMT